MIVARQTIIIIITVLTVELLLVETGIGIGLIQVGGIISVLFQEAGLIISITLGRW